MKTQNLWLALFALLIGSSAFAQSFERTVYDPKRDYNHYSIEQTTEGYVCVGTRFAEDNNDIHIIQLDPIGNVLWERFIDRTKDDRGLDVVVDPDKNIVLTGYISPEGPGYSNLYVAKMDAAGNYLSDVYIPNYKASAGTNIIYSREKNTYIVGGFRAALNQVVLTDNRALVAEFDLSLTLSNIRELFYDDRHQSINDIIEVRGGYFLTGSLETPTGAGLGVQGVMAVKVDYGLNLVTNLSFASSDRTHCGVSLVYNIEKDEIFILSNNSTYRNPQLTWFTNISGVPALVANYLLLLDPDGEKYQPAAFKLEECLWDEKHLIASGYFRTRENDYGTDNTLAWIIEFEKETGNRVAGWEWYIPPANGFYLQGGGVLSTFITPLQYIYNQEMMIPRLDKRGYVMIAPRLIEDKFGIDIMTTNFMDETPCFKKIDFEPKELKYKELKVDEKKPEVEPKKPELKPERYESKYEIFCDEIFAFRAPGTPGVLSTEELPNKQVMNVYPNPSNNTFNVQLSGEVNGTLEIRNTLGQVVFQSAPIKGTNVRVEIDASNFENGVYVLTYSNGTEQLTQRITKY